MKYRGTKKTKKKNRHRIALAPTTGGSMLPRLKTNLVLMQREKGDTSELEDPASVLGGKKRIGKKRKKKKKKLSDPRKKKTKQKKNNRKTT